MRNSGQPLPVHSGENHRELKRHHTVRYYARRVKESLASQVTKFICATVLIVLLVLGIIAFILWLSLRPHRPRFHITDFSIPNLAQSNGFANAAIIFNVTARNSNQHVGFYYNSVVGSVYYREQQIGSSKLADQFYQEPKNTTVLYEVLSGSTSTVTSQSWSQFLNERAQGTVGFRVDVSSAIKFKVFRWTSKGHRMHASCDVSVGQNGLILEKSRNFRCPVYFL